MSPRRSAAHSHVSRFGRGRSYVLALPQPPAGLLDDVRLFGLTFLGGLTFMSIYLA